MKKNICFVLDQFLYGGIERVAINYLKAIDKNKYNLDVIILSNTEDMIKQIPKECRIIKINIPRNHNPLSRASTMIRRDAGAILYYGSYILKTLFIEPIDYFKTKGLREKKYDVAIAFSGHVNDCYVVLKFIKATKKIVWAHGMIYQYLMMSPAFEKMYKKFDTLVSINNLDQSDIFYTKPYLHLNIVNLYNPTIEMKMNSKLEENYGKYILSVARLESPKDFITLINAYNNLDKKIISEYKLLIVGDGPDRKLIENEIDRLNLKDNVVLVGAQTNVVKYYKNASLFVLSTKVEGLGMVIVEAMGNGCPVIATDAPFGPRDIIRNNEFGILCPVGDYQKMSEEMTNLLTNEALRNNYIKQGYKRYKDFTSETIINKFYQIIDDDTKE